MKEELRPKSLSKSDESMQESLSSEAVSVGEELSQEERARIRAEVASVLEDLAGREARRELLRFDQRIQEGELDPTRQEEYFDAIDEELEKLGEERAQARKAFWEKARLSLVPLMVLFATPNQDAPTAPAPGTGAYAERFDAARQLTEHGITNYQRSTYKGSFSEAIERGVNPYFYSRDVNTADVFRALAGVARGVVSTDDPEQRALEVFRTGAVDAGQHFNMEHGREMIGNRYDAWRLYLGIPQEHHTFGISNFRPEHSSQDQYYYRINNFLRDTQELINGSSELRGMKPIELLLAIEARQGTHVPLEDRIGTALLINPEQRFTPEDDITTIMGHFRLSKGEDAHGHYISYYDRWDLGESIEGVGGLVGNPYEIYDRIYYNPATFEVVQPRN